MSETAVLQSIRLALGTDPCLRLFRNNVGSLPGPQGHPIRFGLHPGSADLIGWRTITITPDDLGRQIAQFLSIEVKTASGKPRPDQEQWAQIVRGAGGLAGVARSADQARVIARLTR